MKPGEWYLEYRLIKWCFIPHDSWLPWKHFSMYSHKNINILRNFFREHYLKSNLQQLSHSMFCKNIARLAVAMERKYVWQKKFLLPKFFFCLKLFLSKKIFFAKKYFSEKKILDFSKKISMKKDFREKNFVTFSFSFFFFFFSFSFSSSSETFREALMSFRVTALLVPP